MAAAYNLGYPAVYDADNSRSEILSLGAELVKDCNLEILKFEVRNFHPSGRLFGFLIRKPTRTDEVKLRMAIATTCRFPFRDHVIQYQGIVTLFLVKSGNFGIKACLQTGIVNAHCR